MVQERYLSDIYSMALHINASFGLAMLALFLKAHVFVGCGLLRLCLIPGQACGGFSLKCFLQEFFKNRK